MKIINLSRKYKLNPFQHLINGFLHLPVVFCIFSEVVYTHDGFTVLNCSAGSARFGSWLEAD